jgi:hypothetical protein
MASRFRLPVAVAAIFTACGGVTGQHGDPTSKSHGKGGSAAAAADVDGGGAVADSTMAGAAGAAAAGSSSGATGAEASVGAAGAGATPASGGASAATGSTPGGGAGGSAGRTGSGGAAGKTDVDAASPITDPNAERRHGLSRTYCVVCSDIPDCISSYDVEWYNDVPVACLDALEASIDCAVKNKCAEPVNGGTIGAGVCLDERVALATCIGQHQLSGTVTGSSGTCNWYRQSAGASCSLSCPDDFTRFYDADCSGPPDGPFSCWCRLNGRTLVDNFVSNGARFFADSCIGAGELMADGHCQKYVSCCYTYRGIKLGETAESDICVCTSDPTAGGTNGYHSCADAAADAKQGRIVDLCPQYEPT